MLVKILATPPVTLTGLRDAALVSTGYDTLCRSSEIAAMQVEHIRRGANDTASILIPRSKADRAGNGRIAHFSPATVECLDQWLEAAGIDEGPLFQALHLGRPSGRPLRTCSIRRLVKRAARSAGLPELIADQLSGHSMRVGAAQDMMVTGFDMLAIMQAGGWTTPHVVSRYVENASTRGLHERRWAALGDLASFVSASSKSGAVFERF
jgi:integrase